MSSRFICDCVKHGKSLKPVKNDDNQYVCANCGLVLPDDFDPEETKQREEEHELGSEMDFTKIISDPEKETVTSYADRLRHIQSRVEEEEDNSWISKKHEQIHQQAVELSKELGLEINPESIRQIVQQLIDFRFQDYDSYDLLPPLAMVITIKQNEIDLEIEAITQQINGLDEEKLLKYYQIFDKRTP